MELHQLRYLVAVARTGNFSRAAAQCHVSQPSLSQQIQKLEDELGERLFDRLKTTARLTAAGETLRARALRILAEVDAARREAAESRALARGRIALGILPTIAPYLLPRVLPAFHTAHPGLEIVVQEDTTAQLLGLVAACELDLAVASLPLRDDRFHAEPLFSEDLRLALPPDHPLIGRRTLRAADLAGERFILMKEGHCLGDQVLDFCSRRDLHPGIRCRSTQIETIRTLVDAGMGISLIPAMACPTEPALQSRYRRLAAPSPRRTVVACWLETRPPGRAGLALLRHLRAAAPSPEPKPR